MILLTIILGLLIITSIVVAIKVETKVFIGTGALVIVLLIAIFTQGVKTIDATEIGVIRTFGEVTGTLTPGLKIINPLTQTLTRYDTRVHVQQLKFSAYSKDSQVIDVAAEVQYQLTPDKVMDVVTKYGSYEILETKLVNVVSENIKIVLSNKTATTLLEQRASLSAEVAEQINVLEENFLIRFTSAVVQDVSFSDAFESAVEAKMVTEQNTLKAKNEAETAKINAEKDRDVAKVKAEQRVFEAQAESDALDIQRQALSNYTPEQLEYLKAMEYYTHWDGHLPAYVGGSNDNIMITAE